VKKFIATIFTAVFLWAGSVSAGALTLFDPFEYGVHSSLFNLRPTTGGGDTLKIALSNTAPTITWSALTSVTQIESGDGYTTGGNEIVVDSLSQIGGVMTLVANADVTWTGSGDGMASARYFILYDDTSSDLLIGYWDYGSSFILVNGRSIIFDVEGVTILTVSQ
jgi:hypothetical protein